MSLNKLLLKNMEFTKVQEKHRYNIVVICQIIKF